VGLVVACTIAVRTVIALSRLDELELERYAGNLGWALMHGVQLDPDQLPIIPHLRGSVVFGVLAVPYLWALGPTLWALKLLAITWSALGAGLTALAAGRAFGPRAAIPAGLFLALAPPAFQMVDVLALGSHADTIPFIAGALCLMLGPGIQPATGTSIRTYLALGALFGFSLFFSMQLWVAAPALGLVWWIRDRKILRRKGALWAALAALPGLLLIPVVTKSATLVNKPLTERLLDGSLLRIPVKFGRALFYELPASWLYAPFGSAWAGWALGLVLLGGLGVATVGIPWRRLWSGTVSSAPVAARAFAIVHVIALLAAYSASDFKVNLDAFEDGMGSRYFMPLMPAMAFLTADLLGRLDRWRPRVAWSLMGGLAAIGVAGIAPHWNPKSGLDSPPVAATEMYAFATHIPYSAGPSLSARIALVDTLEPDWGELRALAHSETFVLESRLTLAQLRQAFDALRAIRPEYQVYGFTGLGAVCGRMLYDELAAHSFRGLTQLETGPLLLEEFSSNVEIVADFLQSHELSWFMRGMGKQLVGIQNAGILPALNNGPGSAQTAARIGFKVLDGLPEGTRIDATFGMGFRFGLRLTPYERAPRVIIGELDMLTDPARRIFIEAAAQGYRMRFREASFNPYAPFSVRELFDEDDRVWFDEGLRAGLKSVETAGLGD
jgi:hypothetical protein